MIYKHFLPLKLSLKETPKRKNRYSITVDILSFERCSIQYGAFNARKYEPALALEMFYGTIIHQVLDKVHHYFKEYKMVPSDDHIEKFFLEVEKSLIARGLRPVDKVRDKALEILTKFNRIEGSKLYKRVIETECKLQVDKGSYILHGNVDVLAASEDNPDEVEIWDYKGSKYPSIMYEHIHQQYKYQMQVYAELYRRKTGKIPKRAILYFLNELQYEEELKTPENAIIEVEINPKDVDIAMDKFEKTVLEIEKCKRENHWREPQIAPPQSTCDACDLRWGCEAAKRFKRYYELRTP